jgi:indole-3-glycerol phosphate synthase
MDILKTIISHKRKELEIRKKSVPVNRLEDSEFFRCKMPSFFEAIAAPGPSVIAEFKRMSPSRGIINIHAEIEQVAKEYQDAGIAALSILTDNKFFGGGEQDLKNVAGFSQIPILRKDFIIDEYQIVESRSIGAAAILLIASVLTKKEVNSFAELAANLGMDVLFEIHDKEDIDKISRHIKIAGINNRNLKTFRVDLERSAELIALLPEKFLKVSESGISGYRDAKKLYELGYDAFLVGELFMREESPGKAASVFIKDLRKHTQ